MCLKNFVVLSVVMLFSRSIVQGGQLQVSPEAASASFSAQRSSEISGLRLVKFSGVLRSPLGQPLTGVAGVTFAIYKDQEGGAPLWLETQNVQLNQGNYSVLLGSTTGEGIPLDIFSSNEPRWLGVRAQIPDSEEQPRLLLVGVPYALKAADADKLGGKPVSAFMLADSAADKNSSSAVSRDAGGSRTVSKDNSTTALVDGSGTPGRLVKFTTAPEIGDSIVQESGGRIGINTPPAYPLHIFNPAYTSPAVRSNILLKLQSNALGADSNIQFSDGVANSAEFGMTGGAFYITGNGTEFFRIAPSGRVGIGTTNPGQLLEVSGGNIALGRTNGVAYSRYIGLGGPNGEIAEGASGGAQIKFGNASNNDNYLQFITHRAGQSHSVRMTVDRDGNVGIGTADPTTKLDVLGSVKTSGQLVSTVPDGTAPFAVSSTTQVANLNASFIGGMSADAARTRGIVYLGGCDTCSPLTDTDDQKTIYLNVIGPMTIQSVTCFSDAVSPSPLPLINIQRDDGTPANILTSSLSCDGVPTNSFSAGESVLGLNEKLDFVMVTAGGAAKRVTVAIKATVN